MGSNPSVTSGSAGASTPAQGNWGAWQSLQSATQYIQNAGTPQAATAGSWNMLMTSYICAGMTGGVLLPVVGLSYSWI